MEVSDNKSNSIDFLWHKFQTGDYELEFSEIASVLGMNIQSVRNLLFRALEKLRRDLNNTGIGGLSDVEMFLLIVFRRIKKENT